MSKNTTFFILMSASFLFLFNQQAEAMHHEEKPGTTAPASHAARICPPSPKQMNEAMSLGMLGSIYTKDNGQSFNPRMSASWSADDDDWTASDKKKGNVITGIVALTTQAQPAEAGSHLSYLAVPHTKLFVEYQGTLQNIRVHALHAGTLIVSGDCFVEQESAAAH